MERRRCLLCIARLGCSKLLVVGDQDMVGPGLSLNHVFCGDRLISWLHTWLECDVGSCQVKPQGVSEGPSTLDISLFPMVSEYKS